MIIITSQNQSQNQYKRYLFFFYRNFYFFINILFFFFFFIKNKESINEQRQVKIHPFLIPNRAMFDQKAGPRRQSVDPRQ